MSVSHVGTGHICAGHYSPAPPPQQGHSCICSPGGFSQTQSILVHIPSHQWCFCRWWLNRCCVISFNVFLMSWFSSGETSSGALPAGSWFDLWNGGNCWGKSIIGYLVDLKGLWCHSSLYDLQLSSLSRSKKKKVVKLQVKHATLTSEGPMLSKSLPFLIICASASQLKVIWASLERKKHRYLWHVSLKKFC